MSLDRLTDHATSASKSPRLFGKLAVETEFGNFLGDTRIRLLEAIDQHGSISQAAKAVPLSYKAAWDAVDAMNNLADSPLVERSVGGRQGGGTQLTDYGKRLVALYRAMEQEYQETLNRLADRLGQEGQADVAEFKGLLRRIAMKTSARNQFVGRITALREGAVSFEVSLRLDERNELTAVITRESAENLDLKIGKEVHAFVKASSVLLMTGEGMRTSARNHLWGTVARVHPGAVNSEVAISLGEGRVVTAIVTDDSVKSLALQEGQPACAVIKASSIILAIYE